MVEDSSKVRENRLRRMAERQGLSLSKSRRRDPRALDYEGWMITDARTGKVIAGNSPRDYALSVNDVEAYLTAPVPAASRSTDGTGPTP